MNSIDLAPFFVGYSVISVIAWIVIAVLHFAIALLINANANEIETIRIPPYVATWIWTLAALLGGIFVLGLYWLMYHSTLRRP